MGSISSLYYIHFSTDGKVTTCWNNNFESRNGQVKSPKSSKTSKFSHSYLYTEELPSPPIYRRPFTTKTNVSSVMIITPPANVTMEGDIMKIQPKLQVLGKLENGTEVGLGGKLVIAVKVGHGRVYPLLFERKLKGDVAKKLKHPLPLSSQPQDEIIYTDQNGFVTFTQLAFETSGEAGNGQKGRIFHNIINWFAYF